MKHFAWMIGNTF